MAKPWSRLSAQRQVRTDAACRRRLPVGRAEGAITNERVSDQSSELVDVIVRDLAKRQSLDHPSKPKRRVSWEAVENGRPHDLDILPRCRYSPRPTAGDHISSKEY